MGKVFVFTAPRTTGYLDYEDAPLKPDEVRIKTLYSGISAGTELTYYRGTNPYLSKHWDADARMFVAGEQQSSTTYPVTNLGYEEVGEIVEVGAGVADIAVGTHLFGTWGHRTHFVANLDYVRPRLMPESADPVFGIFSHLGAIALNGVHDADIKLGDTVAIFGMGALGQIVAQMAKRSGAKIIAIDLHDSRLEMAKSLGVEVTINAKDKPAETIKSLTKGLGADVCIEVSGSTVALNEAIRSVAYSARVVAMGFFQGEANGLYLGDEFHHNRINLVCSQISGVSPETSYRWNKMRLWQTAVRLQSDGWLDLRPLITHRAEFERAGEMYEMLDQRPNEILLAMLEFGKAQS
jgi:threonine dehydrogenase-like Zn-dependent dehydrogenase